ncbi:hypothetical protein BKE17_01995 [Enhydrobacter sp. H5]|nr:hypothetical protein BKE17_01995 [Enhydrobacter sp. H5]BDD45218.1 hypothetical protein 2 [Moraxellaceae bacterium]
MNQYKDTTQTTTALKAQNKRQIDSQTKVTFHDVAKSILIAFFMVGLLLLISSYQSAYPKNNLPNMAAMNNNSTTTKHITAKPSRHSLAIFVPKINPTTNRTIAAGAKTRHIFSLSHNEEVISYDGLMGVNTRPKGNSPSRLCAVVQSRHPLPLVKVTNLTNHIGVVSHG